MRYVIDACNMIFRDDRLEETLNERGFQAARDLLVAMLTAFSRNTGAEEVLLVFDGSEKGSHRPRFQREAAGRVTLIYADPRSNADRFIVDLVEDAERPGEITVVSSDKFIIEHVRRAGGKHIGSGPFLKKMRNAARHAKDPLSGEDPRKFASGGLSQREVEEWMRYFGFQEDD